MGPGFLARTQITERWLAKLRPESALEIGCGRGNLTARAAELTGWIIGVDTSPEAVRIARNACAGSADAHVALADINALPFREDFDVVILAEVLEHLDDAAGALKSAAVLLKEDGRLIVTVPAHQRLWTEQDIVAGHKRRYSRGEIRALIEDAGFDIVEFICWGYPITRQLVLRGGSAAARHRQEGRATLPLLMRLARAVYAPFARPVARVEYLFSGLDRGVGYALLARKRS